MKRLTMVDFANAYTEIHVNNKKSKSFGTTIKHIKHYFRGMYFNEINFTHIQGYRKWRAEHGVKQNTINREHSVLIHMFYCARRWIKKGILPAFQLPEDNPASEVKKVNERQYVRKRVLQPPEIKVLLDTALTVSHDIWKIIMMAVLTTLRKKDLNGLTMDNVNEATHQLEGVQAKTGKPYNIPLTPTILRVLDLKNAKYKLLNFKNFRRSFERSRKLSGLQYFRFSDLRRSGAKIMLDKGVNIKTVSDRLGHTSLKMTQDYVPSSRKDIVEAGIKLEGALIS